MQHIRGEMNKAIRLIEHIERKLKGRTGGIISIEKELKDLKSKQETINKVFNYESKN